MEILAFSAQVASGMFCTLLALGMTSRGIQKTKKDIDDKVEPTPMTWEKRLKNWPKTFAVLFLWVLGPALIVSAF